MKHLSDSCLVVDSLGAAARRELLEEFVQLQLLPYERLFGPDRPHFALDQVRSTGFMICPLPLFFNGVSCLEITLLVSNSHFQLSTLCQCLSLSSSLPLSLPLLHQLFLYLCLTFFSLCYSLSMSLSSFLSVSLFFFTVFLSFSPSPCLTLSPCLSLSLSPFTWVLIRY